MIEVAKENNVHLHDGTVPLYSPNLKVLKRIFKQNREESEK